MKKISTLLLGAVFIFLTAACSDNSPDPIEPDINLTELLSRNDWLITRLDGEQLGLIFNGGFPLPISFDYFSFGADSTDCRLDDFMDFQVNGDYFIRSGMNICPDNLEVITEGLWDVSSNGDTLNLRDPESFMVGIFYSPSNIALYQDFTFDPDTSPLDFLLTRISANQDTLQFLYTFTYEGLDVLASEPASVNSEIHMELVRKN